jgi:hypothetical protein
MKYILLCLIFLSIEVKAQWSDDFSDGNYSTSPSWTGDTAEFRVNQSFQLQLNAPAVSGLAYVSTSSSIGYKASWTFLVKMEFNPSSSNYARVYLMADQADLSLPLQGYFLRIGGTNDDLCLFRKDGDSETLLADGRDKIFNTTIVNARIKVTRDANNTWELFCDTTGGENYSLSATAIDGTFLTSSYFGVQCVYTSTRSTKFYFDDFEVSGEEYVEPKPVADTTQLYDIVFNEIMADPTPVAGLPECEYLELYNRSKGPVNMKGWKLTMGSYTYDIPEIQMPVGGYLIITSEADTSKFSSFGHVLGLVSSTALNNTGLYLKLENRDGRLIDWVEYDDSWYGDEFKAQGGYSLEQIDPWNPCGGKTNWKASTANPGGTPGRKNSVYSENPDVSVPDLLRVNVPNDSTIQLYFTEPLDSVSSTNVKNFNVDQGVGSPKRVVVLSKNFSALQLTLTDRLSPGYVYNLAITRDITDCVGRQITNDISIPVGLPSFPDSSDMVLNEVLFNARVGGSDYIELYNRSPKMLNARNLLIGTKADGIVKNLCRLSESGFLIAPSDYLVISGNCEEVKPFYVVKNEKCFVDVACMPSLDDKSSTLVLENDTFGKIDEFTYSETMHLPTLKSLEGISLERVNPDRPSFYPGNWHSAAETAGYGTPGYQNSQYLADTVSSSAIWLSDDMFSPDNDGYKDMLQVSYRFDKPDCRAQVYIFDAMGVLVKRLFTNELLGTEGSFAWDGTNDAGRLCKVGMYVFFIRTVFDDGTVKEYKKSCVLAMKR